MDEALRAELLELEAAEQAFRRRMHEEMEAELARTRTTIRSSSSARSPRWRTPWPPAKRPPPTLAYLTDRVRVARGEPERLDERRAAVGLEPFAD